MMKGAGNLTPSSIWFPTSAIELALEMLSVLVVSDMRWMILR
jgi:hypothetical protein